MESTSFMRVEEVAQELGISKSYAYKIVQRLNVELEEKRHFDHLRASEQKVFYGAHLLRCRKKGVIALAVYKEPKTNTWRVIYRYTDWNGELKADNQMEWVGRMNNIRSRAMEMVNNDLIYARDPAACISTSVETIDPPKVFWKYYDLYRRKRISLSEYAAATGLSAFAIRHFLKNVVEKSPKAIEKPKQI